MIGHQDAVTVWYSASAAPMQGRDHQDPQRRNPDRDIDVRGAMDDASGSGEQPGHVEIRAEREHEEQRGGEDGPVTLRRTRYPPAAPEIECRWRLPADTALRQVTPATATSANR